MPGPLELLNILVILLAMIGVPVTIAVVLLASRPRSQGTEPCREFVPDSPSGGSQEVVRAELVEPRRGENCG